MAITRRDPYPLQWPEGWKRSRGRGIPRFGAKSFAWVRDSIIRQLNKRGSHVVITSDLPLRQDGLPYANGRCDDPGVAVYWVEQGHERVIACDRWRQISLNMRAIDLSLTAMRALDRWGASEMVDKAFAGFAALPAGPAAAPKKTWKEIFGVEGLQHVLGNAELLAIIKQRHRDRIKLVHPDLGGDPTIAAELNAALDDAERELGGSS
jgi:hypothetical protein